MEVGIYLHIPFCVQRCNYCDFVSNVAKESQYEMYVVALHQEIALYKELFPDIVISTIYFGGGTPSLLKGEHIQGLLQELRKNFYIKEQSEITIEANPGTMDEAKLNCWLESGINRLSMGVQSTGDRLLRKLGRIHNFDMVQESLTQAQKVGFSNISVDLMYGLPDQSLEALQESVKWAVHSGVKHISIYGLQVEENTVFGNWAKAGKLILPSEELTERMYDYITEELPRYGFQRYEISNYAISGFESCHNQAYWQDKAYIGMGAGAHGYLQGERWENYETLQEYIKYCSIGMLPIKEKITLSSKEHMEEVCFLSLRTREGIDKQSFRKKFGNDIEFYYGKKLEKLIAKNLLVDKGNWLSLTALGMKFGNLVFEEFLI